MSLENTLKLVATAILLIVIDRAEFAYYAFDGNGKTVLFWCCHGPIAQSWWVQLESYYFQMFLFTVVLWMWLPLKKEFAFVVIAFFLCMPEFAFTYGVPLAKIPLPVFDWFIPVSVSTLRLLAVIYYLVTVVRENIFKQ